MEKAETNGGQAVRQGHEKRCCDAFGRLMPEKLSPNVGMTTGAATCEVALSAESVASLLKKLEDIDEKLGEILNELKGKPNRALHG